MKNSLKFIIAAIVCCSVTKSNAQCTLDAGTDQSICCPGGSVLLSTAFSSTGCVCPNVTYVWTPTTGLSSPTSPTTMASPNTTTSYTVCAIKYDKFCVTECCRACDVVLVTVNTGCCKMTGLNDENSEARGLKVYPNPVKNFMTVEKPAEARAIDLKLYDINGKMVWQKLGLTDEKVNVETASYPRGIYFMKGSVDGHEIYSQKIVVE